MVTNQKLFSVGTFDFRFQHLLIIGILLSSFSISMMIRSQPVNYGFELNEFDPFFNYRATQYLLDNGLDSYNSWIDEKSWYPYGRDVSETSQSMLHFTSAISYKLFGFDTSLYDFTIIFPLIFISLSSIVIFAFVRVLGGTTAGLIASLLFSISFPIAARGLIGWFKSEPLGLFFGLLSLYLFLSGINSNQQKISFIKLSFAGLFLSSGFASWGGTQFFLLPIIIFILLLPIISKKNKFLLWAIPLFVSSILISTLMFERPALSFVFGYGGLILMGATAFVIICCIIKIFYSKKYVSYFLLISFVSIGIVLIMSEQIDLPSFRYLNAINPILISSIPLVDSVSEHLSVSVHTSYSFFSILLIFSGIGIWIILHSYNNSLKKEMVIFSLIIGLFGTYISSVFVRLEVFTAIAVIIFSSIGISIILSKVFQKQNNHKTSSKIYKSILIPAIIVLLTIPIILPTSSSNWLSAANHPPTLMTGGSNFGAYNHDWIQAMDWLKNNTPEDSVVMSWWDYGYWITTLSERKTLADNATLIDWQIEKIAISFLTNPVDSWHILHSDYNTDISDYLGMNYFEVFDVETDNEFSTEYEKTHDGKKCEIISKFKAKQLGIHEQYCNPLTKGLDADYVLIYMTATPIPSDSLIQLYKLDGGGDFQKKYWFMNIAKVQLQKYLLPDGESGTELFWEETLLGKLIPFSPLYYADPKTGFVGTEYFDGSVTLYVKNIKYSKDTDPFELVYSSPSFLNDDGKMKISSVLIYKINHEFL